MITKKQLDALWKLVAHVDNEGRIPAEANEGVNIHTLRALKRNGLIEQIFTDREGPGAWHYLVTARGWTFLRRES